MSYIETFPVQHSTIIRMYSERDEINMSPEYQRAGGVWTLEKKQLLVDSILNDYDLPKIYFHANTREQRKNSGFAYAVIDGRQRLEAIWQFIDGKFTLSDDFVFQSDENIVLKNLGYEDIAKEYPKIKIKFDSFVLPVIGVETDDIDLIEDMFSRLNEAVPLNAAERRNAIGGELVAGIRSVSEHPFFANKVRFSNRRYQHREVSARMLLIEECFLNGKLVDTKKEYLDELAKKYHSGHAAHVSSLCTAVVDNLNRMQEIFMDRDELLAAQGNIGVYYISTRLAIAHGQIERVTRRRLLEFKNIVRDNRDRAEENYSDATFELLEFDRLSQQGTNDASNLRERVRVLAEFMGTPALEI